MDRINKIISLAAKLVQGAVFALLTIAAVMLAGWLTLSHSPAVLGVIKPHLPLITLVFVVMPIFLFLLMLGLGTRYGEGLVNKPNRFRPANFDERNVAPEGDGLRLKSDLPYEADLTGVFTKVEDGRAKIIESVGNDFREVILNYPGHTFRGLIESGLTHEMADYWKIIQTPEGERSMHPIGHWPFWSWKTLVFSTYRLAWWGWQRTLYNWKGLVFVGLPGFRQVRTYRLEYFVSDENKGKMSLERHVSYSDHYRVAPFQFFVEIGSAETNTLVAVRKLISQLMWVTNPYKAAYNSDNNWGSFIRARLASTATEVVNMLEVESVVALDANSTLFTQMKERFTALVAEGAPFYNIGFMFDEDGLTMPDRTTEDPDAKAKLAERAFANVDADAARTRAEGDRDARKLRADGDAYAIEENAKAIAKHGASGLAVADIESRERTVRAAPEGSTLLVGVGQGVDPTAAATYAKVNQDKGTNS